VIISSDGLIITNAHVVANASQITIVLTDYSEYIAEIVGIDNVHDIAVLRIDSSYLQYATLGTSSDLVIGEWAIAIGNPYGLLMRDSMPSVSVGVISALNRNFINHEDGMIFTGMIQTDAAINPGNSGGPLINIYGEVIGINSFIFSETGFASGVGFAIPIDRVIRIAEELIIHGKIREAYLGFRVQSLTLNIADYLGLNTTDGVIVYFVDTGSPAGNAGIRLGEVIIAINNVQLRNVTDFDIAVSEFTPGDSIILRVLRDDREHDINFIAGSRSSN
jgi:serine protease Do